MYYQAGLTSTANESFAEALKWDPEHAVALKYSGGGKKASGGNGGKGLGGIFSLFRRSKGDKPSAKKKAGAKEAPPKRPAEKKARSN